MNFMNMVGWLDGAALLIMLCCALDGSRMILWRYEPLRAIGYWALGVGAFGCIVYCHTSTWQEAMFELTQHTGVAILAVMHLSRRLKHPMRSERKSEQRTINYGRDSKRHRSGTV